jgi:hypothetical protein
MLTNGRVVWALWGALAATAVLALFVLLAGSRAPAAGDPLDADDPMPAVSLTGAPVTTSTDSATTGPTSSPDPMTSSPSPERTTEIVTPRNEPPTRVPSTPGDDDDDDDDDNDDDDNDDDDNDDDDNDDD